MGWKNFKRHTRRPRQEARKDNVGELAKLRPSLLQNRLQKLNDFVAEFPTAMQRWGEVRKELEENAQAQYSSLKRSWVPISDEFSRYSTEIENEICRFSDHAIRTWRSATWFFDRWLAPSDLQDRLQNHLLRSYFEVPKSPERPSSFLNCYSESERLGGFVPDIDLSPIHKTAIQISERRQLALSSRVRLFVEQVESSTGLGNGQWLRGWNGWKDEWETGRSYWRQACPELPNWEFPLKQKLHGRILDERALAKAESEQKDLLAALERIERESVELREKHGFSDKTIAAAAAYFNKTEDLADRLRRVMIKELEQQASCPYCGGPIGDTPQLDHIHARSHGGLSTRINLVFSCADCNSKKSDLTLLEFADLMEFDFREVVRRLRAMGKRA